MNTSDIKFKDLSDDDKPREKLERLGVNALSNSELIAILLRSGNNKESAVELAQRIAFSCGNDLEKLAKLSVNDLMEAFEGVGLAKASSIIAAMELSRRRMANDVKEPERIYDSNSVYRLISPVLMDLDHEEFWAIFLNKGMKVIQKERLSMGGIDGTVVDVRLLFRAAIQAKSCSLIIAHNHPSGQLVASKEDKLITEKIKSTGQLLDIHLQDHIIVAKRSYYSFADEGIL